MSILKTIISTAETVDLLLDKSGVEKKALVLENLRLHLGTEVYDRYYFMISETIDLLCDISKNGLKTTINTNVDVLQKDCLKIFSCLK
tara:strand:- start:717 stop:980 length:264 start_codon:yes stop_codon:yes gene_type:complete